MVKRRDFILAAILVAAALVFYIVLQVKKEDGAQVVVYEDGTKKCAYSLKENGSFQIETKNGENTLIIENGKAYVAVADCADKICERMGKISKTGENIVCLPHKLVIQVEGAEQSDYDIK